MTTSTTTRTTGSTTGRPSGLPAVGAALYDHAITERDNARAQLQRLTAQLATLLADLDEVIAQRDDAEAWADRLAAAIAPADVLGEYTPDNDPWVNALDHAEKFGGGAR